MNRKLWLVPPAITLAGVLTGAYLSQTEAPSYDYQNLAEAWPRLSPGIRQEIAVIMQDGMMTQWEWSGIEHRALESAGIFKGFALKDHGSAKEALRANVKDLGTFTH